MLRQTRRLAEAPLLPQTDEIFADHSKEAEGLIRIIRREAKRRRRLNAWIVPLIGAGMASTIFVFSRVDIRLSLLIFAVSAILVAASLARKASHWEHLALRAAQVGDVRAIGPLLTVLNDRDSSACDTIEVALIALLPRVRSLAQLSRTARQELTRLLMGFEMPGLRGGHNAELARIGLETVARFRDCVALPAVRRLAEGFTATRPAAAIRDLANDILPDLEERAALLRPARLEIDTLEYLRPVTGGTQNQVSADLVRPIACPPSSGEDEIVSLVAVTDEVPTLYETRSWLNPSESTPCEERLSA